MPLVLVAGTIVAKPKAEAFPAHGRPRCEVRIKVEDNTAAIFRIVGYDDQMAELELLSPGDSVAIQGRLEIESKDGRLAGLFVVASQVMALRKRSRMAALRCELG
jgi:hypothetical protein